MVLCAIFGCGTRTVRDKGVYMARIPSVVTNQGDEKRILSEERRKKWISAISRKDLMLTPMTHRLGVNLVKFRVTNALY